MKNETDHFDEEDLSDSCISINNKNSITPKKKAENESEK